MASLRVADVASALGRELRAGVLSLRHQGRVARRPPWSSRSSGTWRDWTRHWPRAGDADRAAAPHPGVVRPDRRRAGLDDLDRRVRHGAARADHPPVAADDGQAVVQRPAVGDRGGRGRRRFTCADPAASVARIGALLDGLTIAVLVYGTVTRSQLQERGCARRPPTRSASTAWPRSPEAGPNGRAHQTIHRIGASAGSDAGTVELGTRGAGRTADVVLHRRSPRARRACRPIVGANLKL